MLHLMLEVWKSLRGSSSVGFSLLCWGREIIMTAPCACVISTSVCLEHAGWTQASIGDKALQYSKFSQILWKLIAVQSGKKLVTFSRPPEERATVWINHWLSSETPLWISRSSYRFGGMCSVAHMKEIVNWPSPVQLKKFWLERQCIVMQ